MSGLARVVEERTALPGATSDGGGGGPCGAPHIDR